MKRNTQRAESNFIRLNDDDWDDIFPEALFKIGKTTVILKPLALKDIAGVARLVSDLRNNVSKILRGKGDTSLELAKIIVADCPQLLAALSGLDPADIKRLPAALAVDLAVKCVDINISSSEGFLKNLVALANKLGVVAPTINKE